MNDTGYASAAERAAQILRERPSALISDVDGTLSPIVSTPEEAIVLPECRRALKAMAGRLDLVAVVSGRTAPDARRMVGLDELLYVGNHGLERWDRGRGYQSEASAFEGEMRELRATLERELRDVEGVRVEDKTSILSLHYRLALQPEATRTKLLDLLRRVLPQGRFAVREGKMVIEVRPPLAFDKGTIVVSLVEEYGLKGIVFLGDDVTDTDGMRALRGMRPAGVAGLSVGVGGNEAPPQLAEASDVILGGPSDVAAFLRRLVDIL